MAAALREGFPTHMTYSALTRPKMVSVPLLTSLEMPGASSDSVLLAVKLSDPLWLLSINFLFSKDRVAMETVEF